jgi:hypothetical protein
MFHELRKFLQELRGQYARLSLADVVVLVLLVIGLLVLLDGIVKRMR